MQCISDSNARSVFEIEWNWFVCDSIVVFIHLVEHCSKNNKRSDFHVHGIRCVVWIEMTWEAQWLQCDTPTIVTKSHSFEAQWKHHAFEKHCVNEHCITNGFHFSSKETKRKHEWYDGKAKQDNQQQWALFCMWNERVAAEMVTSWLKTNFEWICQSNWIKRT